MITGGSVLMGIKYILSKSYNHDNSGKQSAKFCYKLIILDITAIKSMYTN